MPVRLWPSAPYYLCNTSETLVVSTFNCLITLEGYAKVLHINTPYLHIRGSTYCYSRRVPRDLQERYSTKIMKIDKRNFDLKPLGYILFILSCIAWILIVLYREIQKYFCYLLSNYYLFVADLYKIRYIRKQFIKTYLVERVFINYYLATIFFKQK